MATFVKINSGLPSQQRSTLITAVADGDQVDVEAILGRPARGVQFSMTDATDSISYKLNNLVRLTQHNETSVDSTLLVWSSAAKFVTYTSTGSLTHTTVEGLAVSSFEITGLTLSTGTTIEVVVW